MMKSFIVSCLLITMVCVVFAVDKGKKECKPGDHWKEDCNTCICNDEGKKMCTLLVCPTKDPKDCESDGKGKSGSDEKHPHDTNKKQCKPGDKWKEDCNTCTCRDDGTKECTEIDCSTKKSRDRELDGKHKKSCKPGDQWKEDCNTCICSEDGTKVCTLMACPPKKSSDCDADVDDAHGSDKHKKRCKPGDRWKEDCNKCICSEDGREMCTTKVCPGKHDRDPDYHYSSSISCTPGMAFMINCNDCICAEDGNSAYCTKMECPPHTLRPWSFPSWKDAWSDFGFF